MIVRFSHRTWEQVYSIARNNRKFIIFLLLWSSCIYYLTAFLKLDALILPMAPAALLGGALAFFLGFRNNSAYDRWWEARKVWGGIVNTCRIFGATIVSLNEKNPEMITWKRKMIFNHLAWINAVRIQLRKMDDWSDVKKFLDMQTFDDLKSVNNKATQLGTLQAAGLMYAKDQEMIDGFDHQILLAYVQELFALQGQAERIKNTVFPYFYQYFTRLFLWLFILVLPMALTGIMGWQTIPVAVSVAFVFYILEKTSNITDQPLEPRSSGTPMTQICRTIEIDLLEQLGEENVPEAYEPRKTRHGSVYVD